jgi:heparanase 1
VQRAYFAAELHLFCRGSLCSAAVFSVSLSCCGSEPDLFCRSNSTILPEMMARDFESLRHTLDVVEQTSGQHRYLLLGPDTAGIGEHITNSTTGNPKAIYLHYFAQFCGNLTGPVVLDEVTFHQYYFKGPTADPTGDQFISVEILDSLRPKIAIATEHGNAVSKRGAALGETSSAYDGGAPHLSDSFASTFSWVDKLGMSARLGLTRVMRQQLCCGAPYDLLQDHGHRPTADYWATLLWKRLMGGRVLGVRGDEQPGRSLRSYAHCAANCSHGSGGCVALALINVRRTSVSLSLRVGSSSGGGGAPAQRREVSQLAALMTRRARHVPATAPP